MLLKYQLSDAVNDQEIKRALRAASRACGMSDQLSWLDGLTLSMENGRVYVDFIHPHFAAWFMRNKSGDFERLARLAGPEGLEFCYNTAIRQAAPHKKKSFFPSESSTGEDRQIDHFADFISNEKNSLALAAARRVCSGGHADCPILFTGPTGAGKSHLLKAVARALMARQTPFFFDKAACFCANLPQLPTSRNTAVFWQNNQALILDDLHEIMAQTAYENILCAFVDASAKYEHPPWLVFAFTGAAAALGQFKTRLRSLLESGLLVEMRPADMDVRIRWLERSNRKLGLGLPREQILFLARLGCQIPILQGILHKIEFFAKIYDRMPTMRDMEILAREGGQKPLPGWRDILARVASRLDISEDDIMGTSRKPDFVLGRQLAMYLCRHKLGFSFPELGRIFGGKDHSTVMYAVKKIEDLKVTDKMLQKLLTDIDPDGD